MKFYRECEPGSDWTYNGKMAPIRLRANQLTKEATTTWLYLIFSYIEPKSHFTDITLDVATLLYCILDDKQVDLHKLIHNKMKDTFKSRLLPFPSLVMRLAEENGIHPDEGELMIETSEHAKVIPHGIKFKGEAAESSRPWRRHSTTEGSSLNPMAAVWQRLTEIETRTMNRLASNEHRNKQRYGQLMVMAKGQDPGPEEPDTPEEEVEQPTDHESGEE
ncbi:uncharacterized protein [Arachis hypogaea]|uniref:uncharacterized protein n=1 Tax=Arachis hypogaea TaxID=3818 RepID=UPI000DECBC55|nr:uncharacterized protein LOC112715360 [Arachis hypogaea]QHO15812.1 uncharacterized protein DS421_10g298120 [Arachis hypogaea]